MKILKNLKQGNVFWDKKILHVLKQLLVCFTEKAMATHFGTLAWKIPCMEEPGRLQSMGLLKVRHN